VKTKAKARYVPKPQLYKNSVLQAGAVSLADGFGAVAAAALRATGGNKGEFTSALNCVTADSRATSTRNSGRKTARSM
jgi:hypothetical protein